MNRLEIAARILIGMYANPNTVGTREEIICEALLAADELILHEEETRDEAREGV